MPSAICNVCRSLVHWVVRKGNTQKKQQCNCGSVLLTSVAGKLINDEWIYIDRKGVVRKIVPVEKFQSGSSNK